MLGGGMLPVSWFAAIFMIGIVSSQWIEDIRLVEGGYPHEGRVEVLLNSSNEWGTVCDDYWQIEDAEVMCRQLGYNGAIKAPEGAHFGRGTGPIWHVACSGNEARLQDCKFNTTENCNHGEDASVICQLPGYIGCFNDRISVPVFPHKEEQSNDVDTLRCIKRCYQAGYVFAGLEFGSWCYCGQNDTMYDRRGQVGDLDCNHPCNGNSDLFCGGNRLVGVFDVRKAVCPDLTSQNAIIEGDDSLIFGSVVYFSCKVGFGNINLQCSQSAGEVKWIPDVPTCPDMTQPDVRLVNGDYPNMGRIEVMNISGEWGTVCDDYWRHQEAEVVCRQIGYNGYIRANRNASFGEGTVQVFPDNVDCSSYEARLNECSSSSEINCGHDEDAGVTCQLPGYLGCFNDRSVDRVLPFNTIKGPSVHALQCIVHCSDQGFVFAGVERGDECYCGRSDTAYDRLGTVRRTVCNETCSGNRNLKCGGDAAIGVFDVRKAHCPDPGVPLGGARSGNSFVFGSTVNFSCEDGFQLTGEPSLRCLLARRHADETGGVVGWSSDTPQCIGHGSTMLPDADATSPKRITTCHASIVPIVAAASISVILLVIFFVMWRRYAPMPNILPGTNTQGTAVKKQETRNV